MEQKPRLVRVDSADPPTFSCAVCGWMPGCTGTPAPLIWAVIRHCLTEHWDRCEPTGPMKPHHVELAQADGALYARCRCGWEGTRWRGHEEDAMRGAELQARAHEQARSAGVGTPEGDVTKPPTKAHPDASPL